MMSSRLVAALSAAITLATTTSAYAQWQRENEPNGTSATANAITSNPAKVTANAYGNGDVDFYAITVAGPAKVYATCMTSFSAGSTDSTLDVIASDGTTVIENDLADGTFGASSSSVANTSLPGAGTYFLRVTGGTATAQLRGYDLYVHVREDASTAETEPNETSGTANPLPANGWVSGDTSATTDVDYFSLALNSGDTIVAILDADPERDNVQWNGQLGVSVFGGFILTINDASTGSATNPLSEAHIMTVKDAGTYFVRVNLPTGGTTFGTYTLSVSVIPAESCPTGTSTVYTSADSFPIAIPDLGSATSTIVVPGNPRVGRMRVTVNLAHNLMADMDVGLIAPGGNEVELFNDVGYATVGTPPAAGQAVMNVTFDDHAGIPCALYTVQNTTHFQPELNYRLDWFAGQDAGGTWTLVVRDDRTGDAGTITGWTLEICEDPLETCPTEGTFTVYSNDFETDDGGFTHSGTADEWERGLPTLAPITTANSGTNCWKTDLDGQYENSCNQDLLSPVIDLTAATAPIYLRWAQKFSVESASFDHFTVDVQNPGGSNARRLYEWLGASMNVSVGSPTVVVNQAAGWAMFEADISEYTGQQIEVRFNVTTDSSVQYNGVAIDDVSVTACGALPTGACCVGATCTTTTQAACIAAKGTYQGDGASCDPSPCAQPCPADIVPDGAVDVNDLLAVINAWGACPAPCPPSCAADIDPDGGDCTVDVNDLLDVINAWGDCP